MKTLLGNILAHTTHDDAEDSILPVLGQRHVPVQLVARHGLGIDRLGDANPFVVTVHGVAVQIVSILQRLPNGRLTASSGAQQHDGMPHIQQLLEVARLVDESFVVLKILGLGGTDDALLETFVDPGVYRLAHEQIVDEAKEDGNVVAGDLGSVEIAEGPHEDLTLVEGGIGPFHPACDAKDGFDRPQTPVVVRLLGQER
mmetsp:Transcript_31985/g.94085  ORF Transcript_31985/g.94085 Transcript_31985/m.94085 type:complete len:200 (+) Transcript_31985:2098-2697(+)